MNRRKFIWTGAIFVPAARALSQASLRSPAFVGGINKPAAVSSSFILGLDSVGSASDTWGADTSIYYRATASASGTLSKAYVYSGSTAAGVVKVAVYGPETGGSPLNSPLVGVTAAITYGGSAGWYPSSGETITGSITSGDAYYIVIMISSSSPTITEKHNAGGLSTYYKASSGWFASPPATLSAATGTIGNASPVSVYISCV